MKYFLAMKKLLYRIKRWWNIHFLGWVQCPHGTWYGDEELMRLNCGKAEKMFREKGKAK